jgi:ABC-type multidrug transport system fused ATPase/permease subunit
VIELLDERPRVREDPSARQLVRARGLVEIDDVSFAYPGSPLPAVERVSLRVEPGETLALVGPSGAGKSTLAKLMLRFVDPDRGELRLDGHDLRELELGSLRDSVGVLLQETLVFHGTVRENIAYGREGATDEEIVAAARAAGAHEFVERLPDGYDAVIGQKGRLLSGGQRQRIAIARALVREAPVLILDEPSAGLDADAAHALIELLRVLMDGRTTIVISHSLVTVRDATAIALLEHGRVREYGTHEELIESDGAYARLYRLHSAGRAEPAGLA